MNRKSKAYAQQGAFKSVVAFGHVFIPSLVVVGLSGCVTKEIPPTIAHTHIGHALTGWHETPNKQGLLTTAEQEAAIAEDHTQFALVAKSIAGMKEHVRHVIHVLAPDQTKDGPGTGYGMCKALELGYAHIRFAAESDDASANLKAFSAAADKKVDALTSNCAAAVDFAKEIRRTNNEEEVLVLTHELNTVLKELVYGSDKDGDGKVTLNADALGVYSLRDEVEAMTERENPSYQPVASKWLFGLFRLPSGKWAFNLNRDDANQGVGGGY